MIYHDDSIPEIILLLNVPLTPNIVLCVFLLFLIGLYLADFALTPLEIIIVLWFYVARSITIAVKYGFRSQCEMNKFHSEQDPKKAHKLMTKNLLSVWMNPEYSTIVTLIQLASEHAAFKTNMDWFTQQDNLKMKITFIGKERCNKIFDILNIEPGAVGDGTFCPSDNIEHNLDECELQHHLFGSIQGTKKKIFVFLPTGGG